MEKLNHLFKLRVFLGILFFLLFPKFDVYSEEPARDEMSKTMLEFLLKISREVQEIKSDVDDLKKGEREFDEKVQSMENLKSELESLLDSTKNISQLRADMATQVVRMEKLLESINSKDNRLIGLEKRIKENLNLNHVAFEKADQRLEALESNIERIEGLRRDIRFIDNEVYKLGIEMRQLRSRDNPNEGFSWWEKSLRKPKPERLEIEPQR